VADVHNPGASSRQRLWALQQCNAEVYTIDKGLYPPVFKKLSVHLAKVLQQPKLLRNIHSLEQSIIQLCKEIKPDIVWFEWPREFNLSIFIQLQKLHRRPLLISFQDDNPWSFRYSDEWMWRNY